MSTQWISNGTRAVYAQQPAHINGMKVMTERQEEKGIASHVRMLVMLVIFLLVLTVASIILSIVIMVHKRDKSYGLDGHQKGLIINNYLPKEGHPGGYRHNKTWLIAMGDNWGTFERLADDNHGAINGWAKAVVEAACHAGGISCRVVYAPYSQCIESVTPYFNHVLLGKGLARGAFDACSGWYPNQERLNVADFSDGYVLPYKHYAWYHGVYPVGSVTSLRIGFIFGPPGDEKCFLRYMARLGITGSPTFYDYPSHFAGIQGLVDGEIDILFESLREAVLSAHPEVPNLNIYDTDGDGDSSPDDGGNYMTCSLGPAGLVLKKNHVELKNAFNIGLEKILGNGVYKEICERAEFNTGPTPEHRTWCVPYYVS